MGNRDKTGGERNKREEKVIRGRDVVEKGIRRGDSREKEERGYKNKKGEKERKQVMRESKQKEKRRVRTLEKTKEGGVKGRRGEQQEERGENGGLRREG